jgi:predicted metalloprotease
VRFRKDAQLDPSQVEDYRGRGGLGRPGLPVALGGGGGLIAIVVVLAFLLLGGGGGLGDLGALSGHREE